MRLFNVIVDKNISVANMIFRGVDGLVYNWE